MASPDLGTKRTCSSCGARFYDLNKNPVVCPKCEHTFIPEVLLPSKEVQPEPKKAPEKPAPAAAATEEAPAKPEEEDVEVVSLNDMDDDDDSSDDDDDDVAAIEDVDLGDDDDDIDDDADEDAFLEDDDEEDSDVSGLLGGGISEDDEET